MSFRSRKHPECGGEAVTGSQQAEIPVLPIGVYRLSFEGDVKVRRFPESAWRGALGHALRRAACVTREKHCPDCLLYRSCGYAYVFETPPPATAAKMRRYNHVPHPFSLRVEQHSAESTVSVLLNLFGRGNVHLALLVYALTKAAADARGIGGERFELRRVEQRPTPDATTWQTIYSPEEKLAPLPVITPSIPPVPERVLIDIRTPLRVKRDGRHVRPEEFRFADLFGNLLRRISMLTFFHTDVPLETDFQGLTQLAKTVNAECKLTWQDQARYSSRQDSEMQLGGVMGTITVRDTDLAPFWPYLWLGQWTHAGTAATMGLGWYELASLQRQADCA